jgi:DNA-binding NarL/FixJ family response regulator
MTGAEAFTQLQHLHPDVVLMDLSLPDRDGIAASSLLRTAHTASAVVILSLQDDAVIQARVLAAGAEALMSKDEGATAILPAIRHLGQR